MMTFSEFILVEASYTGNLGMMEMFKFYQVASSNEKAHMKALLTDGRQEDAWKFLQKVTKTSLK